MIILQFNNFHLIMAAPVAACMHVTFGTPVARYLVQAIRIIAIHAVMKIHQHAAGEGEVNDHCKRSY